MSVLFRESHFGVEASEPIYIAALWRKYLFHSHINYHGGDFDHDDADDDIDGNEHDDEDDDDAEDDDNDDDDEKNCCWKVKCS